MQRTSSWMCYHSENPILLLHLGYEVCCSYLLFSSRLSSSNTAEALPAEKNPPHRSSPRHVQMPPDLPLASTKLLHISNANISSIFENWEQRTVWNKWKITTECVLESRKYSDWVGEVHNFFKPLSFFRHRGAAVELPACCTRALQQLGLWCRGWACQAVVVPWDVHFSKAMSMEAFTAQCSSCHLGKPLFWKSNSQPLHSVRTSFAAVESFLFLKNADLIYYCIIWCV